MIKIEFGNNTDLNNIRFSEGFKQELFVDTEIEKPEYEYVLEGNENGDKEKIYHFQKLSKRKKFKVVAFEFMVDAISMLPLCDDVKIYANGDIYKAVDIELNIEWQEKTNFAIVEVVFTNKLIIKRITNQNMLEV